MKKENTFLILGAALCFIIACIFSGVYKFSNEQLKQYSLDENVIQNGESYFYGYDEPSVEDNRTLTNYGLGRPQRM